MGGCPNRGLRDEPSQAHYDCLTKFRFRVLRAAHQTSQGQGKITVERLTKGVSVLKSKQARTSMVLEKLCLLDVAAERIDRLVPAYVHHAEDGLAGGSSERKESTM